MKRIKNQYFNNELEILNYIVILRILNYIELLFSTYSILEVIILGLVVYIVYML